MKIYRLRYWNLDADYDVLFYGMPSESQINTCLAELDIPAGPIKIGFNTTELSDTHVLLTEAFIIEGEHDLTGPMPVL